MAYYISSVDLKARKEALKKLKRSFRKLAKDILEGKTPKLVIRKRTLANTVFDAEKGILRIGKATLKRSFLNAGESKKFMQTILMASIIYEALANNEYPTIRDLYYRGKHTIRFRDPISGRVKQENTWEEQKESDSVIRDVEVLIDMLREQMLILSKEKGKVVGEMKIRSGDDIIDLSKMGHGAYSIEPTPDFIEFKEVNAEFVLVIEKDAVFQQLHRAGFWKKYKALLITSAGQPDRATRRFVRRLNEELGLPIYILTDSVPADEVVVVKDLTTDQVMIGPVEEIVGKYFKKNQLKERAIAPLATMSWDPVTGKIRWDPIGYMYRHYIKDKLLKIRLKGRGPVRVTKGHSLFVFRNGKIVVEPAHRIRPGDYILVSERLDLGNSIEYPTIRVSETLKEYICNYEGNQHLCRTIKVIDASGKEVRLEDAADNYLREADYVSISRSKKKVMNKVIVDEDIAWVFGLFTAEGNGYRGRYLRFSLGPREGEKASRIADIIESRFGVRPVIKHGKKGVSVIIASRILYLLFKAIGLLGTARTKRVPPIIINSGRSVIAAYLKGLFDGDGSIDRYENIVYSTRSEVLSKQVFLLLLSLGVNPSVVRNGDDIVIRIGKSRSRTPPETYSYFSGREPGIFPASEPTYGLPISQGLRKDLIKLMNKRATSYSTKNRTISKAKLALLTSQKLLQLPASYGTLVGGDATLARVISVEEEDYEGYVYDFAVPETNSFIGGYGIVYHNSDPYGWYIFSVFKVGSITLSYESERLATPSARLIGVLPSDIYGSRKLKKNPYLSEAERRNYIIKANDRDLKRAKELRAYPWFKTKRWLVELDIFKKYKSKLEIEALTSKGLRFLMDTYIPEKIQTGDWIA